MFRAVQGVGLQGLGDDSPSTQPLFFRLSCGSRATWGPRGLPFASVSNAKPCRASIEGASALHGGVVEKSTGTVYPLEYCCLKTKDCPQLMGVGVRSKRILGIKNINVYALGLYVDGNHAKQALRRYQGVEPDALTQDQRFYADLVEAHDVERTLRLVITFAHISRAQFVRALEERLNPFVERDEDKMLLQTFKQQFDEVDIRPGLEICFVAGPNGRLVTKIAGEKKQDFCSPAIVSALLNIYVGEDTVSPDAKASIGRGLAALLQ